MQESREQKDNKSNVPVNSCYEKINSGYESIKHITKAK
jgi:hypothetical protein